MMTNAERIQANNAELRECIETAKKLPTANGGGTELEDALVGGIAKETITEYSNERVTVLRDYIFNDFSNLQEVNLPNVETVGSYAFNQCKKLTEIDLPLLTSAGSRAFAYTGLSNIYFPLLKSIGSNTFSYITVPHTIHLPSLATASNSCIRDNTGVTRIELDICSKLDILALYNCTKLETLILRKSDAICTLQNINALSGTPIANGTGYVYIPNVLVESYKTATNWVTYANQIRAIEDYPEITGG